MKAADRTIEQLRVYEIDCYRICFYLLQNECQALRAAKDTLLTLFGEEVFWRETGVNRSAFVRRTAVRCSLLVKHS